MLRAFMNNALTPQSKLITYRYKNKIFAEKSSFIKNI